MKLIGEAFGIQVLNVGETINRAQKEYGELMKGVDVPLEGMVSLRSRVWR